MVYIPPGRRGAVLAAASAAVVSLGALAAFGPGRGTDAGYVAVGAAGPSATVTANVPPDGGVDLVPLDGGGPSAEGGSPSGAGREQAGASTSGASASDTPGTGTATSDSTTAGGRTDAGEPAGRSASPAPSARESEGTGGGGGTTAPAESAAPAQLAVSAPSRAASDVRWCEYVTVTFTNTGDQAATSGTITFGTHIIGVLGIDWGTVDTDKPVPVPVKGGEEKEKTWEICVDAWRVPLGMHIETREVSLG